MSFKGLYILLAIGALAACGPDLAPTGTESSEQDLQDCPQACSQACPEGSYCQADANGCMSCKVPAGDYCEQASDCKDAVPQFCQQCPNGSNGCAHWDCVSGACVIITCS
jgi:hypothetical protein